MNKKNKESAALVEWKCGGRVADKMIWNSENVDMLVRSVCGRFMLPICSVEMKPFMGRRLGTYYFPDRRGAGGNRIVMRCKEGSTLIHELAHHLDSCRGRKERRIHGIGFLEAMKDIYKHLMRDDGRKYIIAQQL